MKIEARIVSLKGSELRRAHMARQMGQTRLGWSFFDACTALPEDLTYNPDKARWARGRELSRGELGCYASHVTLWRWFLRESDLDVLCVLEDDIVIDWSFFDQFEGVLNQFPQVDYIRLYAKAPAPFSYLGLTASRRHLVRFKHPVFGTQGYLLRRAGAERFLRGLSEVVRPIDDEMDRFWINGVPIVAVYPFPLTEIGFETTIGMTRHAPPPLGLAAGTRRFAWRAREQARRHTYTARLALPNRGA